MTELEHELKCILDSDEYDLILKVLDTIPYIEETQINYYYDTLSEKLKEIFFYIKIIAVFHF